LSLLKVGTFLGYETTALSWSSESGFKPLETQGFGIEYQHYSGDLLDSASMSIVGGEGSFLDSILDTVVTNGIFFGSAVIPMGSSITTGLVGAIAIFGLGRFGGRQKMGDCDRLRETMQAIWRW